MNGTITLPRSVVEQALEALEHHVEQTRPIYKTTMAIEALIAALEQPQVEQEPVAWTKPNWQSDPWATAVMDEQKKRDVARNDGTPISKFSAAHTIPLYTHPQPPRQPLTCNSCKGLGRVYRGCNEWAACVHCNTTGIGGEK